eukprot:2110748-Rhodomonas_salina.1
MGGKGGRREGEKERGERGTGRVGWARGRVENSAHENLIYQIFPRVEKREGFRVVHIILVCHLDQLLLPAHT